MTRFKKWLTPFFLFLFDSLFFLCLRNMWVLFTCIVLWPLSYLKSCPLEQLCNLGLINLCSVNTNYNFFVLIVVPEPQLDTFIACKARNRFVSLRLADRL